jgi:DUF4097 and DUF4098 domain-containing protein YvlB
MGGEQVTPGREPGPIGRFPRGGEAMNRLRTLSLALLVAMACATAAAAVTVNEKFAQSYSLKAGGIFSINNVNGEIIVEAWDKDTVDLSAVKTVKADNDEDAQTTLKAIRIDVNVTAAQVDVQTKMPHREGWLDWLTGHNINARVDYHVKVPRRLELQVENTNGRVDVSGTNGSARVETTNGSIDADHVEGQLRFTTTNGAMSLRELAGSVRAETTNGGIHAQLSHVEGDLSFETTNGGITLALPSDIRAAVEAETTNGSVHSDFELTGGSKSRRHLSGAINGGGGKLTLGTTNGSIHIAQGIT